ncbi:hypothetical protein GCM10022224_090800 [Nonomuraea antimicrobica]|uniref:Uncharacterized protein n=1 Tax=Nonomuraea antimicrobica TaxID=561173 RepID=A0ABP7DZU7_9ACTN
MTKRPRTADTGKCPRARTWLLGVAEFGQQAFLGRGDHTRDRPSGPEARWPGGSYDAAIASLSRPEVQYVS